MTSYNDILASSSMTAPQTAYQRVTSPTPALNQDLQGAGYFQNLSVNGNPAEQSSAKSWLARHNPLSNPVQPTQSVAPKVSSGSQGVGMYQGQAITPGNDQQIQDQINAINARMNPVNSNVPSYSQPMTGVIGGKSYSSPNNTNNNFSLGKADSVDSGMLNSNNTLSSILDTHSNAMTGLQNGSGSQVASNNLYQELANQTYNSSLYSPQQKQAIQQLSDINSNIFTQNLADNRMIKQMQEDGTLTKEQATAFTSEAKRRNDAQLADLSVAQNAQANTVGVLGDLQKNQIGALQNLSGLLQPQQVAPGSSLYNPVTGVQYQGQGGSPQAILSYAQQLISNDQSQGTLKTDANGDINLGYYQSAAQQAFSGGASGMNQMGANQSSGNQLQSVAQMLVSGQLSPSNIPSGLNQATVLQAANQLSMQTTGQPFNANQAQANYAATQAALIQSATTYRTLANAQSTANKHLDDLQTYYDSLGGLSKGIPLTNSIVNWIKNQYGDAALGNYQLQLQFARGEIAKVLAGGGAPSESENKDAYNLLPDNMAPGQIAGKITAAKKAMNEKIAEYSNTSNVPQYGKQNTSTPSGGIIQTKYGAINPAL